MQVSHTFDRCVPKRSPKPCACRACVNGTVFLYSVEAMWKPGDSLRFARMRGSWTLRSVWKCRCQWTRLVHVAEALFFHFWHAESRWMSSSLTWPSWSSPWFEITLIVFDSMCLKTPPLSERFILLLVSSSCAHCQQWEVYGRPRMAPFLPRSYLTRCGWSRSTSRRHITPRHLVEWLHTP